MNLGNYVVADLISKLNLGAARRLRFVQVNLTDTALEILRILYDQGAIRTFVVREDTISVYYKYYLSRVAIKLSIVSRPGNRIYWTLNKLSLKFNLHNFSGFYIISTQKGLYSSNYCLLQGHLSGEIWIKVEA